MASWFNDLSIRTRIILFGLAMLLPASATLLCLLAADVRHARDSAHQQVRSLATGTAADLRRVLAEAEIILKRLAARPQVQALDAHHCDSTAAEFVSLNPGFLTLDVRDAQGTLVCSHLPMPMAQPMGTGEAGWFAAALRSGGFMASGVSVGPHSGKRIVALSYPIRDGSGAPTGLVVLAVDLLALNRQLLAEIPEGALVMVTDASRALLLRSAEPETYIGRRPAMDEPDLTGGRPEGVLLATGLDGVPRLLAHVALPGTGWRVFAGLPQAQVMAEYDALVKRAIGIGLGMLLLVFFIARRLSRAIVGPLSTLTQVAARHAAGDASVRAPVSGPPDIRALARQFNQMLEAKAVSDARLRGIFETAVDGIITADQAQVIVTANPAAAQMFHCEVADLVGAPLDRFIPQRHRQQHRRGVDAVGAGAATARHMGASRDVTALRSDGQEFPIEASISHLTVDGQRLYTVIHRDVTERRLAQAAVLAGRTKLEAALSSMNDAICISDAQGRFSEFNLAFARFHRFPDIAACKATLAEYPAILELFLPNGEPAPLDQWAVPRALRGESASNVEYGLRRKDTGEAWIGSYSFAPIRAAGGEIVGAVMVGRDVTALKQVQVDLEASHAALQRLIAAQDKVQDEERARIARELHDDLQQTLAAMRIDLGVLGDSLAGAGQAATALVASLDELTAQAIQSTRRIVADLRPQMLEDLGLLVALQALARQFSQRTGVACTVEAGDDLGEAWAAAPRLASCLYRVAQEALNNVAKHARATEVAIRLVRVSAVQVSLSVVDNGLGIKRGDRRKVDSFGILGMRERVRAQGGTLRIAPMAVGTLLEVLVPLGLALNTAGADGAPKAAPAAFDAWFPESATGGMERAPLPRLLTRTAAQTLQGVIDAMAGSVVVLDRDGVVRFVNRGWTEFAERNGNPGALAMGPGVNYLEVCRRSARSDPSAQAVAQGLRDVIDGRATQFSVEYPCHSSEELRWFRMHAAPMTSGDLLVTHFMTRRLDRGSADALG